MATFLLAILLLSTHGAIPAMAAGRQEKFRVCASVLQTNFTKWVQWREKLRYIPHAFLELHQASHDGNWRGYTSVGYAPNGISSLLPWVKHSATRVESQAVSEDEARNKRELGCKEISFEQMRACRNWIMHYKSQLSERSRRTAPAPAETRAPAKTKAPSALSKTASGQEYSLFRNNCANFVQEGWQACTGEEARVANQILWLIPDPRAIELKR